MLDSLESVDSNGVLRAQRRTFLYAVKEFDNTTIYVSKVEPASDDCTDAFGYYNLKQGNSDYGEYFETYEFASGASVANNQIKTPVHEKGITGLSMDADSYVKGKSTGTFKVTLNQDSHYQQLWNNLGTANNPTVYAILDGDSENLIPLALPTAPVILPCWQNIQDRSSDISFLLPFGSQLLQTAPDPLAQAPDLLPTASR